MIRVFENNNFTVDYHESKGMYQVRVFEHDHFKDECWFDSYDLLLTSQWSHELERETGWMKHTCLHCGYVKRTDIHISLGWKYCPNCGALIEGGE